jgi:hypothetical protein
MAQVPNFAHGVAAFLLGLFVEQKLVSIEQFECVVRSAQ